MLHPSPRRGRRVGAGALALVLLASACASGDPTGDPASAPDPDGTETTAPNDPGDTTLPDDMPDTVLRVQSMHGPEAAPSRAFDAWKAAVEEASDGRLQFEMFHAGALAPLTEVEDALAAGLIDVATHLPVYNPARFPVENTVQQLNSVLDSSPVAGVLQGIGAQTDFNRDGIMPMDFRDEGLQPLLLPAMVVPVFHFACADEPVRSLEEAAGVRVRVPSEHIGAEVTALGMTPTATTIAELFEGLERGIVDCVVGTAHDFRDLGLLDVINHWLVDPEVMFSGISSFHVSVSSATWDSLPVEAQRLLWDTAGEVFLPTIVAGLLDDTADSISQALENGIEFHVWADDARTTLQSHQEEVREAAAGDLEAGDAFVARFDELHQQWLDDLSSLGYETGTGVTFQDFASSHASNPVDLDPFVQTIMQTRAAWRP